MSEQARFAAELAESLNLAVRATEYSEDLPTLAGMSEFNAHTIHLHRSIDSGNTIASFELSTAEVSEELETSDNEFGLTSSDAYLESNTVENLPDTGDLEDNSSDNNLIDSDQQKEIASTSELNDTEEISAKVDIAEVNNASEEVSHEATPENVAETIVEELEEVADAEENVAEETQSEESYSENNPEENNDSLILVEEEETSETVDSETKETVYILSDVTETTENDIEDDSVVQVEEDSAQAEDPEEVEPKVSDEEWAMQEFGEDSSIDLVESLTLEDVWEDIIEPEADEATVPLEARKEKDQVVLVVDQLVVSPNGNTTIMGSDGEVASAPVRPAQYSQPQVAPIMYQPVAPASPTPVPNANEASLTMPPPATIQENVAEAPTIPSMPAMPQQQPIIYSPPPNYNSPAEVNVSISAPVQPSQPIQYVENIEAPVSEPAPSAQEYSQYSESPNEVVENMPQEVSEKLRDPDQVIEIRSDATSISANSVSVSSGSTPLPSLVNFDPRKYFNPNEIIPPKLEATIKVEQVSAPDNSYQAESVSRQDESPREKPAITHSSPESLNAVVLPVEEPLSINIEEEPTGDAASRVTQMFGELRRFRDK